MKRNVFVETTLNEVISTAFSWIDHVEYVENCEKMYGNECAIIVCNNGTRYYVNIECDSLGAIIADVVNEALRHQDSNCKAGGGIILSRFLFYKLSVLENR